MTSLPSFIVTVAQATAPQASEQQLLDVDGTLFVMLGLFLLTTFVLTQWLWKPYLRVKAERVTRVDGFREDAARLEREATARMARVEAELAEARRAALQELTRARQEAQAREAKLVAEAQSAAARTLAEAKTKVEAALAAERAGLQARASTLGHEIAAKVLGRGVAS